MAHSAKETLKLWKQHKKQSSDLWRWTITLKWPHESGHVTHLPARGSLADGGVTFYTKELLVAATRWRLHASSSTIITKHFADKVFFYSDVHVGSCQAKLRNIHAQMILSSEKFKALQKHLHDHRMQQQLKCKWPKIRKYTLKNQQVTWNNIYLLVSLTVPSSLCQFFCTNVTRCKTNVNII